MTTAYLGWGIRRRRGDKTLDVTFIQLVKTTPLSSFQSQSSPHGVALAALTLAQQQDVQAAFTTPPTATTTAANSYAVTDTVVVYDATPQEGAIQNTETAYFRLHLLSMRLVKPHGVDLAGVFDNLHTLAWTQQGPMLCEDLATERIKGLQTNQPVQVSHVDKFPYMVNYHVPSGVRIAAGSQVRLGAYLGEGTTVMPAGYINFNAGTLGHAMIEGRVSAGVVVGDSSDVGGGASIMGTLSGGNKAVIRIGEKCLLGANAGTGISLGVGCTIAAGLYVYAGMKIQLIDAHSYPINLAGERVSAGQNVVKAAALSGRDYMLFIKDSQTGVVYCKPNTQVIELNSTLHTNA